MRDLACVVQGVWEKDEVRKDDSFNTFEVSTSTLKTKCHHLSEAYMTQAQTR